MTWDARIKAEHRLFCCLLQGNRQMCTIRSREWQTILRWRSCTASTFCQLQQALSQQNLPSSVRLLGFGRTNGAHCCGGGNPARRSLPRCNLQTRDGGSALSSGFPRLASIGGDRGGAAHVVTGWDIWPCRIINSVQNLTLILIMSTGVFHSRAGFPMKLLVLGVALTLYK